MESLMSSLAERRPIFCSEADFQHELAHKLRRWDQDLGVRLEYPLGTGSRGAIDLLVLGSVKFALELKYLCKGLTASVGNETFVLRNQGAHDIRRYDVCKDIARMELYAKRTGHGAGVLVLSNEPAYWKSRRRIDTADAAFNIAEFAEIGGTLGWSARAGAGTMKGRQSPIEIGGTYPLNWQDYSDVGGRTGRFRYLWVPVSLPQ
jgi:hypothetical protein